MESNAEIMNEHFDYLAREASWRRPITSTTMVELGACRCSTEGQAVLPQVLLGVHPTVGDELLTRELLGAPAVRAPVGPMDRDHG